MNPLHQIAAWLREARRAVVFTGAGLSTESGIPDFRSPGGVWAKYQPVMYQDFLADAASRLEYWRQKSEAHAEFHAAEPNAGHRAIAGWEAAGRVRGVITQNIDGLHQLAGSQQVLELHGTAREVACLDCGARSPADPHVRQFIEEEEVPQCSECGGILKHATISFGQQLPPVVLMEAARWAREADLLLALGSSLVVTPAADLPVETKRRGGRLVIINRDETPLDDLADIVLREPLGEALRGIDAALAKSTD
jgi:NAD-dependent deacetylase